MKYIKKVLLNIRAEDAETFTKISAYAYDNKITLTESIRRFLLMGTCAHEMGWDVKDNQVFKSVPVKDEKMK